MKTARAYAAAVVVGDRMLVLGGNVRHQGGSDSITTVESFNGSEWTMAPSSVHALGNGAAAVVFGGEVYAMNGATVEIFSP